MIKRFDQYDEIRTDLPLKYRSLKDKIFYHYGVRWTSYLLLNSLVEIERNQPFATAKDLIATLEMDRVWVYRHIRFLRDKELINRVGNGKGIADTFYITYFGKKLLVKIENEFISGNNTLQVGSTDCPDSEQLSGEPYR